ncbi:SPW repeat domain-containing protein [Streptomyces sp. enrichment culture]|uniref:SPW repeat domain-containing protein n=1 Tax=Streptomyces sp. enrichment culture TaxID=1795815 RepID=UPI003F57FAFB
MPQALSAPTSAPPVKAASTLQEAARQQIIGLLLLLVSIALMVSPWIVGYPDTAKDAHRNELGVAIVVFLVAMARFFRYPSARSDLFVLVLGVWLAVSPWALSAQKTAVFDGAEITDTLIGCVYVLLSLVSLGMLRRAQRRSRPSQEDSTGVSQKMREG